jgi:hypothetical protein
VKSLTSSEVAAGCCSQHSDTLLISLQPRTKEIVSEGKHAALGVVDQNDFARVEEMVGDYQTANRVFGDHASCRVELDKHFSRASVQEEERGGGQVHEEGAPALRITWASPVFNPRRSSTSMRASIQATTATRCAGRIGWAPGCTAAWIASPCAYFALLARRTSV